MNEFDYIVRLEKFQNLKTKKASRAELDILMKQLSDWAGGYNIRWIYFNNDKLDVQALSFYLHLFTIAIEKYGDGLPQFILDAQDRISDALLYRLKVGNITYPQLMFAFKFTKTVSMQVCLDDLNHINSIVQNNDLPCEFKVKFNAPSEYTNLVRSRTVPTLLALVTYKRQQNNIPLTVLDQLIEETYLHIQKSQEITNVETLIVDFHKSIDTIKDTYERLSIPTVSNYGEQRSA